MSSPTPDAYARNNDEEACAVIVGASRGIGLASVKLLLDSRFKGRVVCMCRDGATAPRLGPLLSNDRVAVVPVDITSEASVAEAAAAVEQLTPRVDLMLNTAGMLGGATGKPSPERSIRAVTSEWMVESFLLHAVGPTLLLKHFAPLLTARQERPPGVFASLSARVGSISDNRLGGWHSYRVSKAAHNQALRTAAVELAPKRITVMALHPGTVDTELSAPFMQTASKRYTIFSAEQSASYMLDVIDHCELADSGGFFDWNRSPITY